MAAAKEQTNVTPIKLGLRDRRLREEVSRTWRIAGQANTRPEDYSKHKALGAASQGLVFSDRVEIVPKDDRWYAEYVVAAVGLGWAELALLFAVDLPEREPGSVSRVPDTHELIAASSSEGGGFKIRRKKDGAIMVSNGGNPFPTEEAAIRHLLDHATMR